MSSRYYNPEWCRWISPYDIEYLDPESVNGLNLYAYCGNDPVNNVDSNGHIAISAALFIGSIIVGAAIGARTSAYSSIKKGDEWYEVALKTISGAALWNIPSGTAPGIGNFASKLFLNSVIGSGMKLSVDAIYALILGEDCGWINGLEKFLKWIF